MRLPQHKNKSVNVHQFAMIPKADIPRSRFDVQTTHKTTFDSGYLVPIYIDEVLPGDAFSLRLTAFARLSTPLFPIMDNLHMETFFFFVPYRLIWTNWVKMMGEQDDPADSIDFTTPQQVTPAGGYAVNSLQDYMGLPTAGQVGAGNTVSHSALPLRAYNLIYRDWFRDENLQDSPVVDKDDGPDTVGDYVLLRRGKRKDYFTGALPWPQKGNIGVTLPLGTFAPVGTWPSDTFSGVQPNLKLRRDTTGERPASDITLGSASGTGQVMDVGAGTPGSASWYPSNLFADLSEATAATINQLRQAFAIQKVLERDARGGTRYTEHVKAHFGVTSPDARLQRPEYIGGGHSAITINPIAQTTQTGLTGGTTPIGTLGAVGATVASGHGFTQSFTEHGVIIGLVNVRADLTYQQGLRKMWSRATRYDYYLPAFAMLGEQAVLNKEIYCDGSATDDQVFGYQERWGEMRYHPSMITGLFKSTSAGTIDPWHLAQNFTALPTLNTTFIQDTPPLSRALAVGTAANGQQIIFDSFFSIRKARPMPMYSVPGLIDHF